MTREPGNPRRPQLQNHSQRKEGLMAPNASTRPRLKGSALAAAAASACALAAAPGIQVGGKRDVAYADRIASRAVPTTCFGHTGPEVKVGRRYSDRECD